MSLPPTQEIIALAIAVADAAARSDVELFARAVQICDLTCYDVTFVAPSDATEEEASALRAAQRAVAYIEARGDVFPWRMVREGDLVRFEDKAVCA